VHHPRPPQPRSPKNSDASSGQAFSEEGGDTPRKQSITEKHAKKIFEMRLTKNSKGQEKPKNSQDVSTGPGGVYHTLLPPKPTETPQLVIEEKESAADRSTFDS